MTRVWIAESLVAQLVAEACEMAPLETGGLLLGYRTEDTDDLVVTHLVGPGDRAEHWSDGFRPDAAFQEAEIERNFAETDGKAFYLGDWHSHPDHPPTPSWKDEGVLRRIKEHREAASAKPLMIIAGIEESQAVLAAWIGERRWFRFRVAEAELRPYPAV